MGGRTCIALWVALSTPVLIFCSLPQIYFPLQRGCFLNELVDKIFLNDVVDIDFSGEGKHEGHFSVTYIFSGSLPQIYFPLQRGSFLGELVDKIFFE